MHGVNLALLQATWETLYMVFVSSVLGIFCGGLLGIFLFVTREPHFFTHKWLNLCLGAVVNLIRSTPFIILLIAIVPFTRLIVGTSIGTNAAVVPLALAAIAFYARIGEAALSGVAKDLIEVGQSMGATHRQIIYKILLPESKPALVKGATLTVIGLIGYSAMAGAIGGGGLGELAINYGYQQFDVWVMLETVAILLLIVQGVQFLGDKIAKKHSLKGVLGVTIACAVICVLSQVWPYFVPQEKVLRVGIMSGVSEKIMVVATEVAQKEYGLKIETVTFSDYMQPNMALASGDIDANIFQHKPFLDEQIKAKNYAIIPIGKTFVYPFGFYSQKLQALSTLKPGAVIAIPNDPTNEGRALMLLQQAHLINLRKNVSLLATVNDIIANPKQLKFKLLDAAQLPRVLKDADLVGLNNDFLGPTGFKAQDALLLESGNSPYANLIVARQQDVNEPQLAQLVAVMHSQAVFDVTQAVFQGGAVKAW